MWDRVLDASVVWSFDRSGYERHRRRFVSEAWRELTGRSVIVTGGTAGIGLAIAARLSGARLSLWGRDVARGQAAALSVGGVFTSVDMGDLEAVAAAAEAWEGSPLAGVVLNAGGMPERRMLTPQGHESIWASQVLGHVVLLGILRRRGLLGPDARVVWVSSGGMYPARLDLSDLSRERGYQKHGVYANAKRAQVVLGGLLAERWPEVPVAVMHPGWVDTEAVQASMPWFYRIMRGSLRTPEQGADTAAWLVGREASWPSGRLWFDREQVATQVFPWTRESAADREALWGLTEAELVRWGG